MRFESIQDVLDHGRAMHRQVADFYRQLDSTSARTRVKLLLDYLVDHEQHLADTLAELGTITDPGILGSWLANAPEPAQFDQILHTPIRQDMTVEEVLEIAMRFDDAMIGMYQSLADNTDNQAVRDLLDNLTDLEDLEKRRVVRNAGMLQDI